MTLSNNQIFNIKKWYHSYDKMTSEENNKKPITFENISLDVIEYDSKYSRCRGTLGQLVRSLQDMSHRVTNQKTDNLYATELYTQIAKQCDELVYRYSQLIQGVAPDRYRSYGYYLNGPLNNGKRRPTTTENERKRYGNSELKETLRSINDRLRHIKRDCIRKKHEENARDNDEVLESIIEFSNTYYKFVRDQLNTWYNFLDKAREKHGILKKKADPVDNVDETENNTVIRLVRKKTDPTASRNRRHHRTR